MDTNNHKYWDRIKSMGIAAMVFPLIIMVAGIILSQKGLTGMVEGYEEGLARIVQYILFAIGIALFFFCDGISDFFAQRLLVNDRQREQENLSSYLAYVFIMLGLLDMISVMGFVGLLISGNLTWMTVFVILTLSLQMRYFPSEGRLRKLLERVKE